MKRFSAMLALVLAIACVINCCPYQITKAFAHEKGELLGDGYMEDLTVLMDQEPLYSEPDSNSEILTRLYYGSYLKCLGYVDGSGYYKVITFDCVEGYVSSRAVYSITTQTFKTAKETEVYTSIRDDAKVIRVFEAGDFVNIYCEVEEYYLILLDVGVGFIKKDANVIKYSDYIDRMIPYSGIALKDITLLAYPDESTELNFGTYPAGTEIEIYTEENGYVAIKCMDEKYWYGVGFVKQDDVFSWKDYILSNPTSAKLSLKATIYACPDENVAFTYRACSTDVKVHKSVGDYVLIRFMDSKTYKLKYGFVKVDMLH